jgi:CheY-like chemotaxis protein
VTFCFEVSDSGIGIAEFAKKNMFQPFSQADASTTRKYGGTGLGLSICKGLVEIMTGEIGFESEQKSGSKFWFQIPLKLTEIAIKPITQVVCQFSPSQRILVVDDNPINQKVAVKMLQKLGHYSDAVATGVEALRSVEKIPYDLILMDCQMPEMDGYEATRRIRNHFLIQLRDIPIVAMTANAIKGDREKCLEAGMDDYVSKPLNLETLSLAIDNNCNKQGDYYDRERDHSKLG